MKPATYAALSRAADQAMSEGDLDEAYRLAVAIDRMERPAYELPSSAVWYATHGIPVFPLQPGTKIPWPRSRGVNDASTDPNVVHGWWTTHPESNIGLATGHLFDVLDVDGVQGNITLARDLLDHPTPDDPYHGIPGVVGVVSTPRPGGRHIYITPPLGRKNFVNKSDGIDFRGLGGYVVAPPSTLDDRDGQHPGTYLWVRGLAVEA